MKLSFVIPAYNEERYIETCLQSIFDEIERAGIQKDVEVFVVNNASTDATREKVLGFSNVTLLEESRRGVNFARQRGFFEAEGERVAFLDADTRLPSGWIEWQEQIFSKDESIVAASGPYSYYDAALLEKLLIESLWWLAALASFFTGSVANGGNFIAKRQALEAVKGFDTRIPFYGDDTDIARRLSEEGRVMFSMSFFVGSSYRRYRKLGLWRTLFYYVMNFFWEVFFKRPFPIQ